MPEDYTLLVSELKNTGIPFAEYGWETAPKGIYGVVALEYEPDSLCGDDGKRERFWEGSADLYFRNLADRDANAAKVEEALRKICQASWRAENMQHEADSGYFHLEWVFQVWG